MALSTYYNTSKGQHSSNGGGNIVEEMVTLLFNYPRYIDILVQSHHSQKRFGQSSEPLNVTSDKPRK